MEIKNIAIILKKNYDNDQSDVISLIELLNSFNFNIYIQHNFDKLRSLKIFELKGNYEDIDLLIVIGGDGTLLSAARNIVNYDIPILGINQGRLGFMTDIPLNDMLVIVKDIVVNGNNFIEERTLIYADILRNNKVINNSTALNDIVISRGLKEGMIEFNMSINKDFVLSQKSDGIIFSTATGSTAYSLAAGGPIISPNASVFAIVPICPQSLTNRPIIVCDNSEIEFILIKENSTQIHFDGQVFNDLYLGDKVVIKKYYKKVKIIHHTTYNYYNTLREKLYWSKRVS